MAQPGKAYNCIGNAKWDDDISFYTATTLFRATDVNVLHELKEALDGEGVYEWHEVENFVGLMKQKQNSPRKIPTRKVPMAGKRSAIPWMKSSAILMSAGFKAGAPYRKSSHKISNHCRQYQNPP